MKIWQRMAALLVLSTGLLACQQQDTKPDPQAQGQDQTQDTLAQCDNCGEVESIQPLTVKGDARPAAALAGAVIGGVIGHQFGSGSGNDAATAAGAVGGAIAGSEIDRQRNSKTLYQVVVRMNDGQRIELTKPAHPGLAVGDEVRLIGDDIRPLS